MNLMGSTDPSACSVYNLTSLQNMSFLKRRLGNKEDWTSDWINYYRGLKNFFEPKTVAVIGATDRPKSVGCTILNNLLALCQTERKFSLYPINPKRQNCFGLPCYPSVVDCPDHVDLAVIVTPLPTVLSVVDSCCEAEVGGVIIITAGFKETGSEGLELERIILRRAREHGIRIIGPNCLGIMSPYWGLNASFAAAHALPGGIAFVSQSGAMCTAILDWSHEYNVGFTAFVSLGSMADVDWGDLIDYFGQEEKTHTIMLYMETVGRPREFLSAARRCRKPIIVLKSGQSESAARAAVSHTGSLAGSHGAFLAAMKRAGVWVISSIGELLNIALFVGNQPHPSGPKLLIVTNAGGPGVLSTDAAVLSGGEVAPLNPSTLTQLDRFLPAPWSHGNPVDILGDASASVFKQTLDVVIKDSSHDGILVILSPQSVTDPEGTARYVIESFNEAKKEKFNRPLFCSWMGGLSVKEGARLLNSNGIPCFQNSDDAARIFSLLWYHRRNTNSEKFSHTQAEKPADAYGKCRALIKKARQEGRTLLSEDESKNILAFYGIPVAQTVFCCSPQDAMKQASQLNVWPLVAKLHSNTLTHKSDVGGVVLNLNNEQEVFDAFIKIKEDVAHYTDEHHFQGITLQPMYDLSSGYELILGSNYDCQLGPLILFGTGGVMVEVYKDTVLELPPISLEKARELVFSTRIGSIFNKSSNKRFRPIDLHQLFRTISLFSLLIAETVAEISEIDINPLFVSQNSTVALDCRVVLHSQCLEQTNQCLLPLSLYPVGYNVIKPWGALRVVSFDDANVLKDNYLSPFVKELIDGLNNSFSLDTFIESVELNDFTHFLGILLYASSHAEQSPIGLFVLEHMCGIRHAGRLLYFSFADYSFELNHLESIMTEILHIVVLEDVFNVIVCEVPHESSSNKKNSIEPFINQLKKLNHVKTLDSQTVLWQN